MIRGSCLCDGVAFEITGELTPIQLCHARRCRKATGAAASPEMLVKKEDLRWVRGSAGVQIYVAPLLDEPPAYRRAFCGGVRITSPGGDRGHWLHGDQPWRPG